MKFKKGQEIKFNFHGFGLVSVEDAVITKVGKTYIEVDGEWKFDKITGVCLNDNTYMGCYRKLPINEQVG